MDSCMAIGVVPGTRDVLCRGTSSSAAGESSPDAGSSTSQNGMLIAIGTITSDECRWLLTHAYMQLAHVCSHCRGRWPPFSDGTEGLQLGKGCNEGMGVRRGVR